MPVRPENIMSIFSAIGDKCPIELQIGAGPYGPPGA
jgi:hypothetical protein